MRKKLCLIGLVVLAGCISISSALNAQEIAGVRVSENVINTGGGENCQLFFQMPFAGTVSAQIYDSDNFLIRNLENNKPANTGIVTINWDGRDNDGVVVPDDAYYFRIEAKTVQGNLVVYDPSLFSGGESIFPITCSLNKERGMITYFLPSMARVRIRAGIKEGPMGNEILNWAPRTEGEKTEKWNGRDNSDVSTLWDDKNFQLSIRAFSLPDNSLITTGNKVGYLEYWQAKARRNNMSFMQLKMYSDAARLAAAKTRQIKTRLLGTVSAKMDDCYFTGRFLDRNPGMAVEIVKVKNGDITAAGEVSGTIGVKITFDDLTKEILSQQRYEVVLYVDNNMMVEEETGYSPYTWMLDTTKLTDGEHLIVVNIATINNQIGTQTIKINVRN